MPKAAVAEDCEWRGVGEAAEGGCGVLKGKVFRIWPEAAEAESVPTEETRSTWRITGPSRAIDGDRKRLRPAATIHVWWDDD